MGSMRCELTNLSYVQDFTGLEGFVIPYSLFADRVTKENSKGKHQERVAIVFYQYLVVADTGIKIKRHHSTYNITKITKKPTVIKKIPGTKVLISIPNEKDLVLVFPNSMDSQPSLGDKFISVLETIRSKQEELGSVDPYRPKTAVPWEGVQSLPSTASFTISKSPTYVPAQADLRKKKKEGPAPRRDLRPKLSSPDLRSRESPQRPPDSSPSPLRTDQKLAEDGDPYQPGQCLLLSPGLLRSPAFLTKDGGAEESAAHSPLSPASQSPILGRINTKGEIELNKEVKADVSFATADAIASAEEQVSKMPDDPQYLKRLLVTNVSQRLEVQSRYAAVVEQNAQLERQVKAKEAELERVSAGQRQATLGRVLSEDSLKGTHGDSSRKDRQDLELRIRELESALESATANNTVPGTGRESDLPAQKLQNDLETLNRTIDQLQQEHKEDTCKIAELSSAIDGLLAEKAGLVQENLYLKMTLTTAMQEPRSVAIDTTPVLQQMTKSLQELSAEITKKLQEPHPSPSPRKDVEMAVDVPYRDFCPTFLASLEDAGATSEELQKFNMLSIRSRSHLGFATAEELMAPPKGIRPERLRAILSYLGYQEGRLPHDTLQPLGTRPAPVPPLPLPSPVRAASVAVENTEYRKALERLKEVALAISAGKGCEEDVERGRAGSVPSTRHLPSTPSGRKLYLAEPLRTPQP